MNKRRLLLLALLIVIINVRVFPSNRAVLIHNSIEAIDACKGKLELKLARIWGGAEEEDEQKFFSYPRAVLVDGKKSVYICDQLNHNIKIFDSSGTYLRTIGGKGRGPADLFGPFSMDFSLDGSLWVGEKSGQRVQCFFHSGKSKTIFRHKGFVWWIGVTAKNEIAVYCHSRTFESRKLLSIYNSKGKFLRDFGFYHDKSRVLFGSEVLYFAKDADDQFYAANTWSPVIRQYSSDGRLIKALTFETPLGVPAHIRINAKGDKIERMEDQRSNRFQVRSKDGAIFFEPREREKGAKKEKYIICGAIGADSQNNIYIVTPRRRLTKKESNATRVSGTFVGLDRKQVDFDIVENIDFYRLLVFNPDGKIIAETQMSTFCDNIYIDENRLFVVDGLYNQRILEYVMVFNK